MRVFEGLLFVFLGIGLIVMTLRSLGQGSLPCGSRGFFEKLEFRRDEEPLGYWTMFAVYSVGGIALLLYGLRLLLGHATPLPLR